MMKFIKKHIKEILIVLFALFALNKCTQSCNRGQKVEEQASLIINKDSCINKQAHIIDSLNRDIDEYQNRLSMYGEFTKERQKSDSLNHEAQKAQNAAINRLANKVRKYR